MSNNPAKPRLTTTRRGILLAGGAVLIGLGVYTMAGAVPRRVSVDVVVAGAPEAGLEVRTVVTSEGEIVAEASEEVTGGERTTLRYPLWLRQTEHRVEVRGRSCVAVERRFTPGEVDRVVVPYRCDSRSSSDSAH